MKPQIPTHTAVWAQALLQKMKRDGFAERDVLKGLGLTSSQFEDPKARWPFDKTLKIFERASTLTSDDLLGFHLAQSPDLVRKAGLLAYVGVSAPTIGGYLRNITRFQRVLGDASKSNLNEGAEAVTLRWHYDVPTGVPVRQYAEFGAIGTLYTLRDYSNRDLRPLYVNFAHQRRNNTNAFKTFFGCRVEFGHAENEIAFKPSDMDNILRTADDDLQRTLMMICESTLAQLPGAPDSMSRKVEKQVTAHLASGTARQSVIASEMGMSARTLSRRLSEEGTNFETVVIELRKALATDYLKDSALPLTEIAFLLGYADASSFSTAFRRWYGHSPSNYRDQHRS